MKTKEQRTGELYASGLVNSIKGLFKDKNVNISEEYYVLMADYIDSLNMVKDSMIINPTEIARRLPNLVSNIQDANLGGIYGITDESGIRIERSLDDNSKKLYFFHELTHDLQTTQENGKEQCGFYNGHDGMFLTEAATQYTAEMLCNISNGTNLNYRQQYGIVRGANDRTTYSPLSEYQYNGDILELLSKSMDLPLPQVLSLAYKQNGRETLKNIYESMDGNQGKFDSLMNNLEQVYSIDKLLISGKGQQLQNQIPLDITMQDGTTTFKGNLDTYKDLMNKTERELASSYIKNHNTNSVLQHDNEITNLLTTPELKHDFLSVIQQLSHDMPQGNIVNLESYRRNNEQTNDTQINMPDGCFINEFGEIIRPIRDAEQEQQKGGELSFKQKIAQRLQKSMMLMNIPFIEKYVNKQLNVLPLTQQERTTINTINTARENFINQLTNFGEYRKLPPIQRMSDPEKMTEIQRKMQQNQQSKDSTERV